MYKNNDILIEKNGSGTLSCIEIQQIEWNILGIRVKHFNVIIITYMIKYPKWKENERIYAFKICNTE